jgi:hypothetical protein
MRSSNLELQQKTASAASAATLQRELSFWLNNK